MSIRACPLLSITLGCLLSVGCGNAEQSRRAEESDASVARPRRGNRIYVPVAWDTVFSIGGAQDSLLRKPRLLGARNGLFYAYDYEAAQIKAFDATGALRWRFGRRGREPGEFINALDLEVASDGEVWAADGGSARVTVISPNGGLRRIIELRGIVVKTVMPGRDETLAIPTSHDHFWIALDSLGQITAEGDFPISELKRVDPVGRTTFGAMSADGKTWTVVFPFGDILVVYQGRAHKCSGRLIEGGPFGRRVRPRPAWATAVAVTDSTVLVLAKGQTADALRIVDEYSIRTCQYRRTMRLPGRFLTMTYSDGILFVEHEDPAPTIVALRPLPP